LERGTDSRKINITKIFKKKEKDSFWAGGVRAIKDLVQEKDQSPEELVDV